MEHPDIQQLLLEKIQQRIADHTKLADSMAEVLGLGLAATYRRMRGETPFRVEELVTLARHYQISLDQLIHQEQAGIVTFRSSILTRPNAQMYDYLTQLRDELRHLIALRIEEAIFSAKDIPALHLFAYPELIRFKTFFWQKSILNDPAVAHKKFTLQAPIFDEASFDELCREISTLYGQLPTTEIWNVETSFSILKQISYYAQAGLFERIQDAEALFDQTELYFNNLRDMAQVGKKTILCPTSPGSFDLYINELVVPDNIIYARWAHGHMTYVINNSIEYMGATHEGFCQHTRRWLENLKAKSELISVISELLRFQFFRRIQQRIDEARVRVSGF